MKVGVFDMPFPDYKAAHGVNQSSLKKLARSPAHVKYAIEHPEEPTPDQIWGQIFDTAIFDQSAFDTQSTFYVRPSHYESEKEGKKPWHNGATFCKKWNAERTDKPIISQADFSAVLIMREEVLRHPAAALALKSGKGASLFCEDADTGLQLKARPDWMSGNAIVDLKTCQDASPDGFARTVAQFGYDIQAAFYLDVANVLGLSKEHFLFVCCEKEPPYCVAVYELDEESIQIGRSKYRRLLNRYLECVVANQWPGYSKDVQFLSLPAWSKKSESYAQQLDDRPALPALEVA